MKYAASTPRIIPKSPEAKITLLRSLNFRFPATKTSIPPAPAPIRIPRTGNLPSSDAAFQIVTNESNSVKKPMMPPANAPKNTCTLRYNIFSKNSKKNSKGTQLAFSHFRLSKQCRGIVSRVFTGPTLWTLRRLQTELLSRLPAPSFRTVGPTTCHRTAHQLQFLPGLHRVHEVHPIERHIPGANDAGGRLNPFTVRLPLPQAPLSAWQLSRLEHYAPVVA